MSDKQPHTLIEDYLRGELSGYALSDFERQLEDSPELVQEVQIHRELYSHFNDEVPDYQLDSKKKEILNDYAKSEEVKAFQNKLKSAKQNFHKKEVSAKPTKVRSLRWIYAVAASILLLIGGYFLINQNTTIQPNDLYASVSTHERLSITEMSTTPTSLQAVEKNFNQKNYAEVLTVLPDFLNELPKTDKNYYNLLRTKGIAELETNQYEKALQSFDRLANSDSIIAPQGKWYTVLTYLKKGDTQKFKTALEEYIKKGHTYKKDQALQLQKNTSMW